MLYLTVIVPWWAKHSVQTIYMATGVVTIIIELMGRNECVSARIFSETRKENLAKTRGEQKGSRNLGRNEDPRL